jgi:hypothetical protein
VLAIIAIALGYVLAIIAIALGLHVTSERNFQRVLGDEEFKIISMQVPGETLGSNVKADQTVICAVFIACIGLSLLAAELCFISTSQHKVDNDVTGPEID